MTRCIVRTPQLARPLLWTRYQLQADVGGWLLAFCSVAESLTTSISVADISYAGNPLVFVNEKFREVTGYSSADVLGRNCRLLQGPETSSAAVLAMKTKLRRGDDVFIRLTNFRKSSDTFENLLCLRTVRDASGKMRFCIGVSLQIDEELEQVLALALPLSSLLTLTPTCGVAQRRRRRS